MILNIFSDTGKVSFFLYIFFLLFILFGLIISIKIIKNDKIEKDRFDRIVELFKFSIVTVCISTVTTLVLDLFKEREFDKDEMTTFNTYIPQIIDSTSSIERKITFCTFFSHVTPNGDLKEGWKSFTQYLVDEKENIDKKKEKEKENVISKINNQDTLKVDDFAEAATQLQETQQIYANTNTVSDNSSYLVIVGTDASNEQALPELKWATENISETARIYEKGKWFITAIPISTSFQDAKLTAEKVRNITNGKRKAYVISSKNIIN